MDPDVVRLQEKLTELRRRDRQFQMFGATTHHYLLNSCLSESTLQEAEAQYSIILPEDYRRFLLLMGDGGAGPEYGIYPLERCLQQSVHDLRLLQAPFPHVDAWNMTPEDLGLDRDKLDEEYFHEAFDEAYFKDTYVQGTLRIGTQGCGYGNLLVIAGSERGHMWCDGRSSDEGIYPLPTIKRPNERLSFFAWYELWLDQSLDPYT